MIRTLLLTLICCLCIGLAATENAAAQCTLTATIDNLTCDDRGTTDPSDDRFSFDLTVTGGPATWSAPTLNASFRDYGTTYTFNDTNLNSPLFYISNGTWTFDITDTSDGTCTSTETVTPPAPCSPSCPWQSGFDTGDVTSTITRDGNGTPGDPNDDSVSGVFTLLVPANIDWSMAVKESGPGSGHLQDYGSYPSSTTSISWGPVPIADYLAEPQNGLVLWYMLDGYTDCLADLWVEFPEPPADCVLTITDSTEGPCDDNGTPGDPGDDTFDVAVNATATNGGASNLFMVSDGASSWGPFTYGSGGTVTGLPADGSTVTLTFTDFDDPSCADNATVSQNSCSSQCTLTATQATPLPCDDNGTPGDPGDDTFDVAVNATATNGGSSNLFMVSDGASSWGPFTYGIGGTVTGLPADGSTVTLTFTDFDDPSCADNATVSQNSCSSQCTLTATQATPLPCDDNGTPGDPGDDTFDVAVNATATNGGANNLFMVSDGASTWGPFTYGSGGTVTGLPADGSTVTLTFTDFDDPSCADNATVSQNSCSSQCTLTATQATPLPCDDNGTPGDPGDDTFDVAVNATATNGGANNLFMVSDGASTWGPFTYGTGGTVTGLPADGSTVTLTFTDFDDPSCADNATVSQNSCSSLCVLTATIDNLTCDDRGTTDPNDDRFSFDLTVNGGPATWSAPTLNANFLTYGTTYTFDDTNLNSPLFYISNGTWTFDITDTSDGTCTTTETVTPPPPCSPSCPWQPGFDTGDVASTITRDDNGTPADPNDDSVSGVFTLLVPANGDWSMAVKEPDPSTNHLQDYGPYPSSTTTVNWGPVPVADYLAAGQNGLVLWYMLDGYTDCLADLWVAFPDLPTGCPEEICIPLNVTKM